MDMVARSSKGTNIKAAVVRTLHISNLLSCLKFRVLSLHADKPNICRGEILILCTTAAIGVRVPRRLIPSQAERLPFYPFLAALALAISACH